MENVSDHGTIGPRKYFGIPENTQEKRIPAKSHTSLPRIKDPGYGVVINRVYKKETYIEENTFGIYVT